MRRIRVLVTLNVDDCEPDAETSREEMEDAAAEAVENVLRHATGAGFPHDREDTLSIEFVDVVPYEESDEDEQP